MTPRHQEKLFPKEYARELMAIARGDLDSAAALQKAWVGRPENIGFHAHQAMEKSLKAALCACGLKVPLVHDLGVLVARLPEDPDRAFGFELTAFDEFVTLRRYLEGPGPVTPDEIAQLMTTARQIVDWAEGVLTKRGL